jgi:hypothetical protein
VNRAFSRLFIAAAAGVAVFAAAGSARAVTAIWDPPSNGDRAFSTPGNWSTGVVPGQNDDVVADGTSSDRRMELDVSIDVKSITTQNGYTGNINFTGNAANSIRVRGNVTLGATGNFECSSGTTRIDGNLSLSSSQTFSGNDGTITILGNVTMTGGTVNNLGGPLTIGGDVSVSGGNFNGGDGLMVVAGGVTLSGGTFRNSGTTTRIGGAFVRTGGTYTTNQGNLLFTAKTNVTHTFGGAVFRKTIINDGMVGYWNLDQNGGTTVTDNSGFTNTGTSTAMTWSTTSGPPLAFGNVSYGTFNGSSSRIALTTSQLPATNAAQSIAAWVNINAMPGSGNWSSIVSLLGSGSAVVLGLTSTGVSVERNDGTLLVPAIALSTGTWHHVAYTWNGINANTLYVDGVAVATSATAHDNSAVTAAYIGATVPTAEFFSGSLDEVRIYDRVLTGTEVSSLALGGTGQTSIATHTFSDAYVATIGGNLADLIIASGTVTGSSSISVEGSWLNYGGRFTGNGTVTLISGASEVLLSGGSSFAALTITAPAPTTRCAIASGSRTGCSRSRPVGSSPVPTRCTPDRWP